MHQGVSPKDETRLARRLKSASQSGAKRTHPLSCSGRATGRSTCVSLGTRLCCWLSRASCAALPGGRLRAQALDDEGAGVGAP